MRLLRVVTLAACILIVAAWIVSVFLPVTFRWDRHRIGLERGRFLCVWDFSLLQPDETLEPPHWEIPGNWWRDEGGDPPSGSFAWLDLNNYFGHAVIPFWFLLPPFARL